MLFMFSVPSFAYSAWQTEAADDLEDLIVELRRAYQLAVSSRAASPDFLEDLEDLVLRFEAFCSTSPSGPVAPAPPRAWSDPVEVSSGGSFPGSDDQIGQTLYYCVQGADSGRIWGTGVYTNDSYLGKAAVHAGLVAVGESAIVAVRILPGREAYEGSTRHGLDSNSYGGYGLSYEFVAYDQDSLLIQDPGRLTDYKEFTGQTLAFQVTGSIDGSAWGTGIYTADSHLATAAVHAGLVKPGETAVVLAEILPGQESYTGSESSGVSSRSYGAFPASYRLRNPQ